MDENDMNVFTVADAADTTPVAVPLREIAGGFAYGDNGGVYEIPEITGADVRMDPEDEARIQEAVEAIRGAGNMNLEIDIGATADASAVSADEIRRAFDRLNGLYNMQAGNAYQQVVDLYAEPDARIDEDEERRFDGLANMVEARDFLREYDRRHTNRADRHTVGGWTMADTENEDRTVRGRRAEMPLWEAIPFEPAPTPQPFDLMRLEEGTEIQIEGINWEGKEHRRFVGYFSPEDMEKMCESHIGDNDVAIAYPTGTVVFRYRGNVVAIPEDMYEAVFMTDHNIERLEDRLVVEIRTHAQGVNVVWHGEGSAVPTKESLDVMDQAFEEVFQ